MRAGVRAWVGRGLAGLIFAAMGAGGLAAQSLVPLDREEGPVFAVPPAEDAGFAPLSEPVMVAGIGGAPAPLHAPQPAVRPGAGRIAMLSAPASRALAEQFRLAGQAGWIVIDVDTGEVLDAELPDRAFAPASVAKLPTALYALDRLGPDWQFETRVVATGEVSGSTVTGDLYLQGGGDPELDTDALLPLIMQLTQSGIRRVDGRFLVDGGAGVEAAAIDPGQPIEAPYNPALSGLCLNFNRVHLAWTPQRGADAMVALEARAARLSPPVAGIRVAVSSYSGAPVFSHAVEGGVEVWRIRNTALRRAGSRWLPVRRPALYAGRVFAGLAAVHGLHLTEPAEAATPVIGRVLARHASRRLAAIIEDMLHHSTNLTAEMVGIAASRAGGMMPHDAGQSAAAMNGWAAGFAGFAPGDPGFRLANHSGLSLISRLSPRRMAELLRAAAARPQTRGYEELHLPGMVAGLLRPHHIGDDGAVVPEGVVVRAKTGTMNFIRGLAGYVRTAGGRRLAFAYFANDLSARGGSGARSWLGRAKGLERALLRSWAVRFDRV